MNTKKLSDNKMKNSTSEQSALVSNNTQQFLLLQFIGWSLFVLVNLLARQYFVHFHLSELVNSVVLGTSLLVVTSILRTYYKNVFDTDHIASCLGHILVGCIVGSAVGLLLYAAIVIPNQELIFGSQVEDLMRQLLLGSPTIFVLLLMWSSVYLIFKKQAALKLARNEQKKLSDSLKEARLDVLLSQLNPHFLFNAINNIRALTLEDSGKARDMLATLSEVMRYTMQIEKAPEILFEKELEVIEHYIALNKLQFEHKLKVEFDIDPDSRSLSLPPMILQLLVENAIKHGIGKLKQGGVILISTRISESNWQLEVENSGTIEVKNENRVHIGLDNIRQRLAINYGDSASFSLTPSKLGVLAKITLPI